MTEKKVPFTTEQIKAIIKKYPTPFHIYDEKAIRENARRFYKAFSWVPGGFKDYFAIAISKHTTTANRATPSIKAAAKIMLIRMLPATSG